MKVSSLRPSHAGRNVSVTGSTGSVYKGVLGYNAQTVISEGVNSAGKKASNTRYFLVPSGSILNTDSVMLQK